MASGRNDFAYPSDLAELVRRRLANMHTRSPALATIREMVEVAFFASMKTEEEEAVLCNLIYLSMVNPNPHPPSRLVANRWSFVRFRQPILFDVKNLVKVCKSTDSAVSSLAVDRGGDGKLYIWGAIDQQGRRTAYTTRENEEGPEVPGLLQVTIAGIGLVEVFKHFTLVGSLRQGRLAYGSMDVLGKPGPIATALETAIARLVNRVRVEVGEGTFQRRDHWVVSITHDWRQALARVLLGIQRYGHGGALLLTTDQRNTGLTIKYTIDYRRLGDAVRRYAVHTIQHCDAEDEFFEQYLDPHLPTMPVALHLDQTVSGDEKDDTRDALTGCVQFIASLSRVDGLILMNHDLSVRGYGAIITGKAAPSRTWVAGDVSGTAAKQREINPAHFGTRHQSMMRICYRRPGSVGFVISQDGDVRTMMRVGNRLVVWEDVKLRLT